MATVFIAIGSNITPECNIASALERLRAASAFELTHVSSWYRTRPWGVENQAVFLNLVVGGTTTLSPHALLHFTQQIENQLGRKRALKNGPRTLDLDLLLYDQRIIDTPELSLPHPGLCERDFMLIPLVEIAPNVVHPQQQAAVKDLTHLIRYPQILEQVPPPNIENHHA